MFGLIWDLRMLGYLPAYVEEICYVCCDFAAKVNPCSNIGAVVQTAYS